MVDPVHDLDGPQLDSPRLDAQEADHAQEEMIDEIYQIATEVSPQNYPVVFPTFSSYHKNDQHDLSSLACF